MTTFKNEVNKLDNHANIDKIEYMLKLQNIKINLPKFIKKRQLFHVKNVCKIINNQQV